MQQLLLRNYDESKAFIMEYSLLIWLWWAFKASLLLTCTWHPFKDFCSRFDRQEGVAKTCTHKVSESLQQIPLLSTFCWQKLWNFSLSSSSEFPVLSDLIATISIWIASSSIALSLGEEEIAVWSTTSEAGNTNLLNNTSKCLEGKKRRLYKPHWTYHNGIR